VVGRGGPAADVWAQGEEAQEHAVKGVFLRQFQVRRADEGEWRSGMFLGRDTEAYVPRSAATYQLCAAEDPARGRVAWADLEAWGLMDGRSYGRRAVLD
jgi:hypothetical protein